jgi:hypothetical protein
VKDAERVLKQKPDQPSARADAARRLSRMAARAERRLSDVDLGAGTWLVPPLANRRADFAAKLEGARDTLRKARIAGGGLARFLEGPRRYLVLAANNAEMRAGSGMFLSAGTLTVEGGHLSLSAMEPTALMRVPAGGVPLTGDLKKLWGWLNPNREWRNLALSPRFDEQALLASRMWAALGRGKVDGVLALDPVVLRSLLRATGPVDVDGRSIDAEGAIQEILHDQYAGLSGAGAENIARRDRLARLASSTIAAFDRGGWDTRVVAREVAGAAAGRHLLAWSADPKEQAMWRSAGVSGAVGPNDIMISVLNRGGNKLDQFLDVRAELGSDGDDRTVRIRLRNTTPRGEPPYVAGPHPLSRAKRGEYLGIVAVTLPLSSVEARIDGVKRLAVAGVDGRSLLVSTTVSLERGESRTLVVRFRRARRPLRILPSARIPAVRWRFGNETWIDESSRDLGLVP